MLHTGSVEVFSPQRQERIRVGEIPDGTTDYGRYKADCEARIQRCCPQSIIVRLGWQIGDAPGSNNMIDYFHRTADAGGRIEVSRRWFPACSFLQDTADSLCGCFDRLKPGIYHLDGNPGLA